MNMKELALKLHNTYKNNSKVRLILDTTGNNVTKESVTKFKAVCDRFENQADEKLVETIIIVDGKLKRMMMSAFIKVFNTKGKVKVVEK